MSQSIDATAAKALFLLLKFLRSPSLMLHADMVVEPAWKEMFQFWMNPGPNSYSWMEHAKGEGEERSKTADAIPVNS